MTDLEQRIAIAQWCGWRNIIFRGIDGNDDYVGHHESCVPPGKTGKWQCRVPDYLNDLNAIHEAERRLPEGSRMTAYINNLFAVVRRGESQPSDCILASAAQRAEALLRTVELWKDSDMTATTG